MPVRWPGWYKEIDFRSIHFYIFALISMLGLAADEKLFLEKLGCFFFKRKTLVGRLGSC